MIYLISGTEMNSKQSGFSLLEVLIALALFAGMATAFITTQTNNISSSIRTLDDAKLLSLAELKMNETLIGKREFTNATKNDVDSGEFDIEGYEGFKYEVKITPIEFPSFDQLMGKDSSDSTSSEQNDPLQKMIFEKLKTNIEEIIWQVNVKVTDTVSGGTYELNSWITKSNAKIDTNFNF